MKHITNFKDLKEGEIYNIECKPFRITNKCRFISHDTTILKRPITYWQLEMYGFDNIDRNKLRVMFDNDTIPQNVFALWDFDLKHNTITTINHKQ